jgi:hypothetical protein
VVWVWTVRTYTVCVGVRVWVVVVHTAQCSRSLDSGQSGPPRIPLLASQTAVHGGLSEGHRCAVFPDLTDLGLLVVGAGCSFVQHIARLHAVSAMQTNP